MHVWLYVVAVLYMVSGAGRPRGVLLVARAHLTPWQAPMARSTLAVAARALTSAEDFTRPRRDAARIGVAATSARVDDD